MLNKHRAGVSKRVESKTAEFVSLRFKLVFHLPIYFRSKIKRRPIWIVIKTNVVGSSPFTGSHTNHVALTGA